MTGRTSKRGFAARPGDAESWVKMPVERGDKTAEFTARLTIDVTPALRGRIKIAAFRQGITAADLLRGLLAREFPETTGAEP